MSEHEEVMQVELIGIDEIYIDQEFNCRGDIKPIDVVDLVKSIENDGLLQPVVVQRLIGQEHKYKLLCGFRRTIAHKVMKRTKINAVVRMEAMSDIEARVLNLSENLKRKDLTIAQEAQSIKHLKQAGLTEEDTSVRLGVSRGWVQVRFLFLKLPECVRDEIEIGSLIQTSIRDLYTILRDQGEDECITAARAMKEARQAGRKIDIRSLPDKRGKIQNNRRQRKVGEIEAMQKIIRDTFGNGLGTKLLGWACGFIDDKSIHETVAEYAEKHNRHYKAPDFR